MKKITSVLLVATLFLLVFSPSAVALEEKSVPVDLPRISGKIDYFSAPDLSGRVDKFYYKQSNGASDYNARSLLDDVQKIVYDEVVKGGTSSMRITINFQKGVFPTSLFSSEFFVPIMNAISVDCPQLFHYAGYGVENAYVYSGSSYISKIDYIIRTYDETTYSEANIYSKYNELMAAVKNADVDTSNRYNFVRSLYNYLCEIATYPDLDSSDYTGQSHDAYGCLVDRKPVCQGYADAFKLICDYYKIPCVCIGGRANGGRHMWNAVQMDDGLWYLIDVTWGDQESYGVFYDFFLSGTDTVSSVSFGYEIFKESHVNDEDIFIPQLNYSPDKYSQTNHNTEFAATYNCLWSTQNKNLVLTYFDAFENNIYYNGMCVEASDNDLYTDSVISVYNSVTGIQDSWSLVLIGDCNCDGYADNADYADAVNMVLSGKSIDSSEAMAADACFDGYLDALDLMMLERAYSGSNTEIVLE